MKKSAKRIAVLIIVFLIFIAYIGYFVYTEQSTYLDLEKGLSPMESEIKEQLICPEKGLSPTESAILEDYFFTGLIDDKHPIQVNFIRKGGAWVNENNCKLKPPYQAGVCPLEGYHLYLKPGTLSEHLLLGGTIDDQGNFQVYDMAPNDPANSRFNNYFDPKDSTVVGKFSGRFDSGRTAASGTWSSADGKQHLPFKLKRVAVNYLYERYKDEDSDEDSNMDHKESELHKEKNDPCNSCSIIYVRYPLLDSSHGKALANLLFQEIGETDVTIEVDTTSGKPNIKTEKTVTASDCKYIHTIYYHEFTIALYVPPLISLKKRYFSEIHLAAHPYSGDTGFNVLLVGQDKVRKIELKDLIRATPSCLRRINNIIREDLHKQEASGRIYLYVHDEEELEKLYTRSFILRPDRFIFMFPTYDIAPYLVGNIQAEVLFDSIEDCIPSASPLRILFQKKK